MQKTYDVIEKLIKDIIRLGSEVAEARVWWFFLLPIFTVKLLASYTVILFFISILKIVFKLITV